MGNQTSFKKLPKEGVATHSTIPLDPPMLWFVYLGFG